MIRNRHLVNSEIQGLRAMAVIAVFVFHLDSGLLPGGFLGVDFFFVLSGFLMAQVLTREIVESGGISVRQFYKRRLKRLLPAMFIVTIVSFPLAYLTLLPSDMRDFSASMVGVVTLTLNKMIANNIGYFSPLAETQPLLHFWSLMVEIQFYALIPLLYLFVGTRPPLLYLILGLTVLVSLGWAQYLSFEDPKDNYFLLPSRLWELSLGCLLFGLVQWRHRSSLSFFKFPPVKQALLVGLVTSFFVFNADVPHPSVLSLIPVFIFSAVLFIVVLSTENSSSKYLGSPILVFVGDRSFSLYLWHFVLIVIVQTGFGELTIVSGIFIVLASFGLAHFTYKFVERPFWRGEAFAPNLTVKTGMYGLMPISIVALGLVGFLNHGFESSWVKRASPDSGRAYQLVKAAQDFSDLDREAPCRFRRNEMSVAIIESVESCSRKHGKGVLVIGDSHAIGVWRLLNYQFRASNRPKLVVGLSRGGCKPYQERKGCAFGWLSENTEWLKKHFDQIVYVQAGSSLLREERIDVEAINQVDEYLSNLGGHVQTTWLGPRLESLIDPRLFISVGCENTSSVFTRDKNDALANLNSYLVTNSRNGSYDFMSGELFNIEPHSSCKALYWRDSNHWSPSGILYLADRVPVKTWLINGGSRGVNTGE